MTSPMTSPVRVQLLHVPDCPLVDRVRTMLDACLRTAGVRVTVEDLEGAYPSPTLLINGVDVVTGAEPREHACCRLDLPTEEQILTALAQPAAVRASE